MQFAKPRQRGACTGVSGDPHTGVDQREVWEEETWEMFATPDGDCEGEEEDGGSTSSEGEDGPDYYGLYCGDVLNKGMYVQG